MTSVTIPNSNISIGSAAFQGTKLTDVYCYAEIVPEITPDVFYSYYILNVTTLHVPAGTIELYQAAEGWKMFKYIVEMNLEPVKGDANGDGAVNAEDIVVAVNYLIGNQSDDFKFDGADTNNDGVVNTADIVAIVNIIMGN